MFTAEEAAKKVRAGVKGLVMEHSGVTFRCDVKDGEAVFVPSFPDKSPQIGERAFLSLYYGKRFGEIKPKPEPAAK